MLSLHDGEKLVNLARSSVEKYFEDENFSIEKTKEKKLNGKRGVFVTLHTFPEGDLRGCIGLPYPNYPMYEAVQRAARSSAFEDVRFESLEKEELNRIIFEVSILSNPKLIKVRNPSEYLKKIEKGKDGLILVYRLSSGLFLPQVWEQIHTVEDFLKNLCWKAGLPSDVWKLKDAQIFKFNVQVFIEKEPKGEIIETKLAKHVA